MTFFKTTTKPFPAQAVSTDEYAIPLLQPDKWLEEASEGELAIDVYELRDQYILQSTLAGVQPPHLSLSLQRDLLTIRGARTNPLAEFEGGHTSGEPLVQECYWGRFSRSILLPEAIDVPRATATLKHGLLTITLPKLIERNTIPVDELS